ncbi:hypothetical protein [Myxococcus landrumensis]|uniref:DUF5648 domain-containing protein n=1 Tax=Myxococcus landrumensis TaxID=2813577 RepID=A0ABX7N5V0_9BACT|nr:hypothetical protein [Myxococcus landrumus]QSQ14111.1 hypothetical protein JY572_38335 [Myxococcus landrumus]
MSGLSCFYTASWPEALNVIQHGGSFEGITGRCQSANEAGTAPLYRLYSGNAGDHLDTLSAEERDIASMQGYTYEGVACYVYPSNQAGLCPLLRLWNGTDHFYTVSIHEAIRSRYNYEGIAAYLFLPPGSGCPF